MEAQPPTRPPDPAPLPPHRPAVPVSSGVTKLDRLVDHSTSLVDEVKTWVDLKLLHAKLEVREDIDAKIKDVRAAVMEQVNKAQAAFMAEYATTILLGAIGGLLGLLALTFLFITLALGIGALVGAMWLGFLIVTVLLLVSAGAVALVLKRRFDTGQVAEDDIAEQDAAKLPENETPTLPEAPRVKDMRERPEGGLPVPADLAEADGHTEHLVVRV